MHYPKCLSSLFTTLFAISLLFGIANGFGGVMKVQRRYVGNHHHFAELKKHAAHRHAQLLRRYKIVDIPMGGNQTTTMYYTELAIGTPPKNYTVHIDTGSDILWINCQDCVGCPMDDDTLGIHLTPYNPSNSKTAKIVTRGKDYCKERAPDRKDDPCPFNVKYLDDTNITGYYVRDYLAYNKVSGDHKSQLAKAKVTFGCVTHQTVNKVGDTYMKWGVEGLIGFGSSNVSMISQLASSGKVRKEFAHCLNPAEGGGIFAIGHVVKPEVKMIPLHPETRSLYAASMRSVEVGGKFAELKAMAVKNLTFIDSGSGAAMLPEDLYHFVIQEIFSNKSDLDVHHGKKNTCFRDPGIRDPGSLDMARFPNINFHFFDRDASKVHPVPLTVTPRDYLFRVEQVWCVGFMNIYNSKYTILGDTALSNKLVVYDAENREIGWTEYDCSSSIELEDGNGGVCAVGAHVQSSQSSSN